MELVNLVREDDRDKRFQKSKRVEQAKKIDEEVYSKVDED